MNNNKKRKLIQRNSTEDANTSTVNELLWQWFPVDKDAEIDDDFIQEEDPHKDEINKFIQEARCEKIYNDKRFAEVNGYLNDNHEIFSQILRFDFEFMKKHFGQMYDDKLLPPMFYENNVDELDIYEELFNYIKMTKLNHEDKSIGKLLKSFKTEELNESMDKDEISSDTNEFNLSVPDIDFNENKEELNTSQDVIITMTKSPPIITFPSTPFFPSSIGMNTRRKHKMSEEIEVITID